jgi:hypothetical protein
LIRNSGIRFTIEAFPESAKLASLKETGFLHGLQSLPPHPNFVSRIIFVFRNRGAMIKRSDTAATEDAVASTSAHNGSALRAAGHRLVDRMADYLESIEQRPVSTPLDPARIGARFAEPLPRAGRPADEVWDEVWERVVEDSNHFAHPRWSSWGTSHTTHSAPGERSTSIIIGFERS